MSRVTDELISLLLLPLSFTVQSQSGGGTIKCYLTATKKNQVSCFSRQCCVVCQGFVNLRTGQRDVKIRQQVKQPPYIYFSCFPGVQFFFFWSAVLTRLLLNVKCTQWSTYGTSYQDCYIFMKSLGLLFGTLLTQGWATLSQTITRALSSVAGTERQEAMSCVIWKKNVHALTGRNKFN